MKLPIHANIANQLPEHIRESYPNFVLFIEAYYEWLHNQNIESGISKGLIDLRDIDKTLDEFVDSIINDLGSFSKSGIATDKRLFVKHLHDLYAAKGSEKSFKLFFRLIYDIDIEVSYPSENILRALGQFMTMAVSSNSRFDHYRRHETGGILTQDELDGYAIFNQKCASCHATDLFTDNSFRNNGLVVNPQVNDVGRYRVTEREEDRYKFRVPSLRNIEKTAPYMHDGRLYTLEAVLNHYASGVSDSPTLDPILNTNGTVGIPLTSDEKTKIIAFLKTLTDNQFLTDTRFSQ